MMHIDLVVIDRRFRYALLFSGLVLGLADHFFGSTQPWIKTLFVIVIAGVLGYFTNYLAIKMLFQPKRGQVLGWQGLVPKNKAQIARSLGSSVQHQLLHPDIVLAYIAERRMIETGTQSLADWLDRSLQNPDVRREVTATLIDLLNQKGPELMTTGLDFAETALKGIARDPAAIRSYWVDIRAAMIEYLQTADNRAQVARKLLQLFQDQLPHIAEWLNRAIEAYLQDRNAVGTLGLGLKNLFSIDDAAIQQFLQRFSEDPKVSEDFLTTLDAVMDSIQKELLSESTQQLVQERLGSWIEQVAAFSRRTLLPGAVDHLNVYLNEPRNWAQIEEYLIQGIAWLKTRALSVLHSETGRRYLRAGIERAVQQLNVTDLVEQQVMKLDTDELEKMVLDNTGGNLTVIQFLGGVLGLIAGLVQVHVLFALPIGAGMVVVWIAYRLNERRAP